LIDFPENTDFHARNQVIKNISDWMSRAPKQKYTPVVRVDDYTSPNLTMNTITTLDLIAVPLDSNNNIQTRDPYKYPDILNHFIDGYIDYIYNVNDYYNMQAFIRGDYHAIMAIGPLLEIPFLKISTQTIDHLIDYIDREDITDSRVEVQFKNVMLKARFGAAGNRFNSNGDIFDISNISNDHRLYNRIKRINNYIQRGKPDLKINQDPPIKALPPIPEFIENKRANCKIILKNRF
jgi:hypothetical protein